MNNSEIKKFVGIQWIKKIGDIFMSKDKSIEERRNVLVTLITTVLMKEAKKRAKRKCNISKEEFSLQAQTEQIDDKGRRRYSSVCVDDDAAMMPDIYGFWTPANDPEYKLYFPETEQYVDPALAFHTKKKAEEYLQDHMHMCPINLQGTDGKDAYINEKTGVIITISEE